jgi:exodeoxyribonuclease VII small subunit
MAARAPDKPLKFEDAISELESIIEQIESGRCGLEECIAQYERGMKLVGSCQSILGAVQQRIAELTADGSGKLQVRELRLTPQNGEALGSEPDDAAAADPDDGGTADDR